MYQNILVALENGKADRALLPHVSELASTIGARLLLLHVADGWAARNYDDLQLSESEEIQADKAYLQSTADQLEEAGVKVQWKLALGNPPEEILRVAGEESCDLIAMSGHGHRLFGDIIHGSAISKVRHKGAIPMLIVSAKGQ